MNKHNAYFSNALTTCMTVTLGALTLIASATALPAVARAEFLFSGTYTAAQKSFTVDARTGAHIAQPEHGGLWIVASSCTMLGCTAHAVRTGEGFDMMFDGKQWNRLAVPRVGICGGVTVPARAAALYLVPQSDGSLTGAVTSTVDCGGVTVDSSQPLTVTPSEPTSA